MKSKQTRGVTEWFPVNVKPVHVGVYETILLSGQGEFLRQGYSLWDGNKWKDTNNDVLSASKNSSIGVQRKKWRGLSSKP